MWGSDPGLGCVVALGLLMASQFIIAAVPLLAGIAAGILLYLLWSLFFYALWELFFG